MYSKYKRDNISVSKDKKEIGIVINYPDILPNMYYISESGKVYSLANDSYILWYIKNGIPYVNLKIKHGNGYTLEPCKIIDLVACSYLKDSINLLNKGYHAAVIDGDQMNCHYKNLVYIKKDKCPVD